MNVYKQKINSLTKHSAVEFEESLTKMEFNKPSTLHLNEDIATNFESFKEEVSILWQLKN